MVQVFKEADYYSEGQPVKNEQPPSWEDYLFSGLEGLRSDFGEVISASKNFPFRSALTVIGAIAVLYIGFKISRSFVKITNRLRG